MLALMSLTHAAVLTFWLSQPGVQPYQAHALTRVARVESGPLADPPHTGRGHCLYQWVGARWAALRAYARTDGCPALEVQLRFASYELRDPWFACFWAAPPGAAYANLRRHFGQGARCQAR